MLQQNIVVLTGNLCRDAEVRPLQNGSMVTIRLAFNDYWTDGNGDKQQKAHYFDVVSFMKGHATLANNGHLTKGRNISIEGSLDYSEWDDKETGQSRNRVRVKARRISFVDFKETNGGSSDGGVQGGDQNDRATTASAPKAGSVPF